MNQKLIIEGQLPSLNDYIAAMNRNRHIGNKMKRQYTEEVVEAVLEQGLKPYDKSVELTFTWVEPNARRDPDNITSFGRKVILDGLVESGILQKDSQRYVSGWQDTWSVGKEPQIIIHIMESGNHNDTTKIYTM